MKKIVLISLLLFSRLSFGYDWIGPFSIDKIWTWLNDGYGLTSVEVKEKELLATGCAITDKEGFLSFWQSGSTSLNNSSLLSTLFYADSQERKVMFWVDRGSCSKWAGLRLLGVKVLREEAIKE